MYECLHIEIIAQTRTLLWKSFFEMKNVLVIHCGSLYIVTKYKYGRGPVAQKLVKFN